MREIQNINDSFVPDCLFECDNPLEIPTLRLDMQAQTCNIPFLCFGEQKRTYDMGGTGTLHFYTDDYRFNSVYDHPEKILQHHPSNIVEPNFSLFADTPIAFGLQSVYKKRVVARMMQERGVRVFVDLNVNSKWYKLNMMGVPQGWGAYCTRGYSDRLTYLEYEYGIAKAHANGNRVLFVVYGGGGSAKAYCRAKGMIYVTPMVTAKRKTAFKEIEETISFMGTPMQIDTIFHDSSLEQQRIADYSQPLGIEN